MTIGHWILIQASFHLLDRGYVDTGSVYVKSMVVFGSFEFCVIRCRDAVFLLLDVPVQIRGFESSEAPSNQRYPPCGRAQEEGCFCTPRPHPYCNIVYKHSEGRQS